MLDGKVILVTGGTGSFGRAFLDAVLAACDPAELIVFSRDEHKQHELRTALAGAGHARVRYRIGDVRDAERVRRALRGVDYVVHAAALKHVPACEDNPFEAIQTNVLGTRHVVEAALDAGVQRVVALSTDKAVGPTNLYGATKLCAEKLVIAANGAGATRLACCRYGNVAASRGSVIPLFLQQRASGRVTVTDPRMTRFALTLSSAAWFVLDCLQSMSGGEVFIPKSPSVNILDLAEAVCPECDIEIVGIRSGEKLHEVLLSEDEARLAVELDDRFVIRPARGAAAHGAAGGLPVAEGFRYASDTNLHWLSGFELRAFVDEAISCGEVPQEGAA